MSQPLLDVTPVTALLARPPFVVLSDIDGTLAPIVEDPDDAHVSPRAHAALTALMGQGVQVGLITGRALERALQIAELPGAIFATNHGLSIWAGGEIEAPAELQEWVVKAEALLPQLIGLHVSGVWVEGKGPIVALHYRRAPNEGEALAAIRVVEAVAIAEGFRVQEGRKVVEIRPPIEVNKGTAARDLAQRMGAASILCIGDDITDADMFHAARSLRDKGVESVLVAVTSPELDQSVLAAADYYVDGVEGVEWLLEALLNELLSTVQSDR